MASNSSPVEVPSLEVAVGPLREQDLREADRIMRLAFGTFLGMSEPEQFGGDAVFIPTRWVANPAAAWGAYIGGALVGSNLAANWGSVATFGPLTVRPDLWDRGIGRRLMEPVMAAFEQWGSRHMGLFTFPASPKHHCLYQSYGFWPRYLTMIMARSTPPAPRAPGWQCLSELPPAEREAAIGACRRLSDGLYEGLDLTIEIRSVAAQRLGETILLGDGDPLEGFAICHIGPGSEAGSDTLYVKFGASRSGADAPQSFSRLLDAVEQLAALRGVGRILAGVNTSHQAAYRQLLARGYRIEIEGVTMHRGADQGYHRPDVFVLDDWR